MLDCPEQTQTSPTSTSLNSIRFFPWITTLVGFLLATMAGNSNRHFPSASACVLDLEAPIWISTFSPGSAQPQNLSFASRWRTIWSPKIAGTLTSARALGTMLKPSAIPTQASNAKSSLRIIVFLRSQNDLSIQKRRRQYNQADGLART